MTFKFLLPVVVGMSIVLQGSLNRNALAYMSLASVVFLNAIIFLFFSAAFWILTKFNVFSGYPNTSMSLIENFHWWQILPGCFGFLIVLSTPLAIKYLGANLTFAVIICTQLVVSMIWDSLTQKIVPTVTSLMGISVMIAGLAVLIWGRK